MKRIHIIDKDSRFLPNYIQLVRSLAMFEYNSTKLPRIITTKTDQNEGVII